MAHLLSVGFLDLEEDGSSFLAFFSGTVEGGEETEPVSLIALTTDMIAGSTKGPSLLGVVAISNFLASRFSFFNLYEGVASCAFCSGVKTRQNLHSVHLLERLWKPQRRGHHVPELGAIFEPVHPIADSIGQLSV